ncbi:MAG TPA: hypothetical protein VFM79_01475 [Pelobium sp.]|nr:hypothetical protein [Pelobium sp.]
MSTDTKRKIDLNIKPFKLVDIKTIVLINETYQAVSDFQTNFYF